MAADHALRVFGLPCLDLWDKLLARAVKLEFHEDNETAIIAMRHGYSPALRHIKRTHGVCLRWLAERFTTTSCSLFYERSALQAADIYTKAFSVPAEWDRAARLINVLDPARFWEGALPRNATHCMPSKHKGEVEFAYTTSNPWHGRGPRNIPRPTATEETHAATPARPSAHVDRHVPWVTAPCSHAA